MGGKAKKPKEDPASIALRKRQTEQLLELDDEQNVRVRRMYNASTGMRSFRGSSDTRLPRGDSSASPGTGNYGLAQSNARALTTKSKFATRREKRELEMYIKTHPPVPGAPS
jgi:hypothetical protein